MKKNYIVILKTTEIGKGEASLSEYMRVYPTMEDAKMDMEKSIMDLLGLDNPKDIYSYGEDNEDMSCEIDEDYAEVRWLDWDETRKKGVEYHWYITDCEVIREVKTLYTYTLSTKGVSVHSLPVICDGNEILNWAIVVEEEPPAEWVCEYGRKEDVVCYLDDLDKVKLCYSMSDKEYYCKVRTYNDNLEEVRSLLNSRAETAVEEAREKAKLLSELLGK